MEKQGDSFSLDQVLGENRRHLKRSKVICTIGPACANTPKISEMLEAGMDIARLNFSHGDHEVIEFYL